MTTFALRVITAYWLIPAEPAYRFLTSTIEDLASRFDAPLFKPHLTVYVSRKADEDPEKTLKEALRGLTAIRLPVSDIHCAEEFTKTLFVQFEPSAELSRLNRAFQQSSPSANGYELNPHLSLIYKKMTKEERTELAASIRLPFTTVLFDTVKAVVCPTTPIRSREDVENWRVVATQRLRG
jgi:2'-5' RNA ligase